MPYSELDKWQLEDLRSRLQDEYEAWKDKGLKLNMARGVPGVEQPALSLGALTNINGREDLFASDGTDTGNYGGLEGIPEARALMAGILEVSPDQVLVGGNSSLNLMHDCMGFAFVHGFPESEAPWHRQEGIRFLCPSPGYDRHFAVTEHFGIGMTPVDMTPGGPDMDQVEELVKDPKVKGIWCVPKYSNPQGIVYSPETVRRLAALKPAAPDFHIFWDNAYAVHHLYEEKTELANLMEELERNGREDMVLMFASTSKITLPGAGIAAVAASEKTMGWLKKHLSLQTIGYDKVNQLRHARFLRDRAGVEAHMEKLAELLRPKFQLVLRTLKRELDGVCGATWTDPKGGYFISLDVMEGCAKRVVSLCADAGVAMTPAGATFPYGNDPRDSNIRIAPTFPGLEELKQAARLLCLCVKLASVEKLLAGGNYRRLAQ